jgi:hypothetical protein
MVLGPVTMVPSGVSPLSRVDLSQFETQIHGSLLGREWITHTLQFVKIMRYGKGCLPVNIVQYTVVHRELQIYVAWLRWIDITRIPEMLGILIFKCREAVTLLSSIEHLLVMSAFVFKSYNLLLNDP